MVLFDEGLEAYNLNLIEKNMPFLLYNPLPYIKKTKIKFRCFVEHYVLM